VLAAIAVPVASAGGPALRQDKIPALGIAVNVPASWIRVDPSRLKSEHIAYATGDPKSTAGFHSNLTLQVTSVPAGTSVRKYLLGNVASKYLALGTLRTVRIHGVTGLEYVTSKLERAGNKPLLTLEYAFVRGGQAYLFTYTALASAKPQLEQLFHASAATIRFLAAPPRSA
jgi:hypothetical protein